MSETVRFTADVAVNLSFRPGDGASVDIAGGPREARRPVEPGEVIEIPAEYADAFEARYGSERPGDASHSGRGPLIAGLRRIG